MPSLKKDLALKLIAGVFGLLIVVGILFYFLLEDILLEAMDRRIMGEARLVALGLELSPEGVEIDLDELNLEELFTEENSEIFTIFDISGREYISNNPKESSSFIPSFLNESNEKSGWFVSKAGKKLRFAFLKFQPKRETDGLPPEDAQRFLKRQIPEMRVFLARDADSLIGSLQQILIVLLAIGAAAIAILTFIISVSLRSGLRPVGELSGKISGLDENSLSRRLELERSVMELNPVVQRVNEFLAKLEHAFNREKQLSSDLAHELRTPLSAIRAKVELALKQPREIEEYQRTLADSHEMVLQMQRIIENLLLLARLDNDQNGREEEICPVTMMQKLWRQFEAAAKEKSVAVEWDYGDMITIKANPVLFTVMINNIFGNAVEYVNREGQIRIRLEREGGSTKIEVCNSGCRLLEADSMKVFDRFWRKDSSRSDSQKHSGLGLALVKRIAELQGGSVSATIEKGQIFSVRIILPPTN